MDRNDTLSKGLLTRHNIIAAASELFCAKGYHATSMRQIARKADVALSGLYNHFPGKEEVFRAVFIENHPYRKIIPALLDAKGETVEVVLRDALLRISQIFETHPQFLNLMFIEIVEFNSLHANEMFASVYPDLLQIAHRITLQFHDALRPIALPVFIRSFFGLFFSYYITGIVFAPRAPEAFTQDALDQMLGVYLHGILAKTND